MNKQVLREVYLEKRKTLTQEEYQRRSNSVTNAAVALPKNSSLKYIHLFLPIGKQREVDTWPILQYLINSQRHSPVVSTTNFKTKEMTHFLVDQSTEFKLDPYGIPSPINGKEISISEIDLVFCPLISFDRTGNRIGYGGGYYDRFLKDCRKDAKRVGLAITPPLDLIPYAEPHDLRLHTCLNHQSRFEFKT